jgi:hypothetical protein
MNKGIYAVLDLVTMAIISGIHLFAHDAAAIRWFGDASSDPHIARHLDDYNLVYLGSLTDASEDIGITPEFRTVMTGINLAATRSTGPALEK